ncbi:MAG TPA: nucleotidyltransferase domain-containing protein [Candidatus Nanoarchaeia archaeon]|nr:nucleotidyltransferase domain-containing protein [Candidatus Nanoarchaeia archaeon]
MEQKSYKLEIVNELLNAEYHIRELARRLNTNHMIIVRKIKELYKENIVDYKREGKNNKYFLKKTIEAKSFAFSAENYKLNKLLKKYPSLRRIIEKIQTNKDIKLAILFGSYAKEIAKVNSDIDVYIETDSKKIREDINSIDSKLSVKIGKYDKSNLLIKEIEKNHVVIKGIEAYYEKNKFFEETS